MSEYVRRGDLWIPEALLKRERAESILRVCIDFMDQDDVEFITELDEEETINYLYGRLLDMGEDPEELLAKYGVLEGENR